MEFPFNFILATAVVTNSEPSETASSTAAASAAGNTAAANSQPVAGSSAHAVLG